MDKDHLWHMGLAHKMSASDPDLVQATEYRLIDLDGSSQVEAALADLEAAREAIIAAMVTDKLHDVSSGCMSIRQRMPSSAPCVETEWDSFLPIMPTHTRKS